MTNTDRVLDFITRFPERDDDEISATLKILPRQQVNQICHRLKKAGQIQRVTGPQGKIVNRLALQP
jgi:DNA-binding IscR family transcriptional regulator